MKVLRAHWPLVLAFAILWVTVGVLFCQVERATNGHLIYTLDDPYIHMAMAKNFVMHGVWGVTRYEFSASSSSPLWTFLLSVCYFIFGVNDIIPFILNVLAATALLIAVYFILDRRLGMQHGVVAAILLGVIFLPPVASLVFTGMEHILQMLIDILFIYLCSEIFMKESVDLSSRQVRAVFLIAPFVVLIRFEGLFLLFTVCLLFLIQRRVLFSVSLGLAGMSLAAIYQAISVAYGWFWLPASVLIKAGFTNPLGRVSFTHLLRSALNGISNAFTTPHIFTFVATSFLLVPLFILLKKEERMRNGSLVFMFLGTTYLHMQFAMTGQFFRYEAYLILIGILVLSAVLRDIVNVISEIYPIKALARPIPVIVALVIAFVSAPTFARAWSSLVMLPYASTNIYEQQYQMGLFLRQYYQGETVGANDIGAINYLADIRCVDLWGVGSKEVARKRMKNDYTSEDIHSLTGPRNLKILVVYEIWFFTETLNGLSLSWPIVGRWQIVNNVVCGGNIVSFVSVHPTEQELLKVHLREFKNSLPSTVIQSGLYTKE